ncbi:O-linked N-acetylglucosamine transferase, SPINDLY family protein [Ideonella sp. BN130291]|uniref:O-linked N-acetylglucosamine transferase, SPINDLY family protein n=1 Tax=Ideonella sp. BN130291 TaxID=3112940 RepID=UPI002E276967|nr:tetratricopeptide repeat protein [Ideonella sp. BN130291]
MSVPTTPMESPTAPEDATLQRARSGAMQLGELLERAQQLHAAGHAEASAQLYEQWIAATDSPHRHIACFNWGTVLGALRRPADAEKAYRQALLLQPDFAQARVNLGHQLEQQGRPEDALAEWDQVLRDITPGTPDGATLRLHALNNMARLLEVQRRFDEAEARMVQSLEFKADQPDVLQHYVHIRQKQCKWPVYQPVGEVSPSQLLIATSPLAMLSVSDDPSLQLMAAQRFVLERVPKAPAVPLHTRGPKREGRIRIGYLSGDLHMHAVGLLTAELYGLHDRSKFEVFGFCWSRDDGTPLRQRIIDGLDHHVRIGGLDDNAAAQLIASLGIDILVDLQGLTSGARPGILVQRPAPIQVSYLGLPGTSALPGVDHIIADRFVMPDELLPYCTERPIYLPHCYQASDRFRPVAAKPERATYGLPDEAFVYCSFNNNFKFTAEVFRSWMRVLGQVPNSVLWLLADNDWARENMLREADAHGVARERLVFAPRVAPPEYLARFQLADLFLDTFPYNAGTTANDVLWMGTPILTCAGRSYISRMAGSLLTAVGLPDLITTSLTDYERQAVLLGREPKRVASYKRYLAEHGRSSALFDMPQLVRDLEAEFERLALAARVR